MTLALASACSPTDRVLVVDGATRRPMPFVAQVDAELVLVTAGAAPINAIPYPNPSSYRWQVERGYGGTSPAQHAIAEVVSEVVPLVAAAVPADPPISAAPTAAAVLSTLVTVAEDAPETFASWLVLVDDQLYVWDGAAYQGPYAPA